MEYQFENLGDERFQEFCTTLIAKEFPNFQAFPVGQPDGGRDALVYLAENPKKEFIVFQVKYVRNADQERDLHHWLNTTLKAEAAKIDQLIPAGAKTYYLLTNVRGTAHAATGSIDKINTIFEQHIKIPAICWWRDDISRLFEKDPLFKWSFPEVLNGQDVLNSLLFDNFSENKERRSAIVTAYLTDQYEIDKEVKFKQIDLQNRLLALFTDVPLRVKKIDKKNIHLRRTVDRVFHDQKNADQDEYPFYNEISTMGAAAFLLHSRTQSTIERILLEGGPGQGKSTISQYVCQVHRIRLLKKEDDLAILTSEVTDTPIRLPLKIDLRDVASWVEKLNPYPDSVPQEYFDANWRNSLESFLVSHVLYHSKIEGFNSSDLLSIFKLSPILIVFDGFDEIANLKSRANVIDFIDKGVTRIKANAKSIQVIITSRPAAFSDSIVFATENYPHFELTDITPEIIKEYVNKWVVAGRLETRDANNLKRLVGEKLNMPHLKELAKSPMQLAIFISLLRTKGQSLPNKRTALFDSYIGLFFDRESEKSELVREKRDLITEIHQYLAWVLHSEAELYKNSGSISLEKLTKRLNEYLIQNGHDSSITDQLFGVMKERVCALVSRVQGTFEFEVQPLREYFCAQYLYTTAQNSTVGQIKPGTKPDRFRAILRSPYWQNVVRFFAGCADAGELDMIIQELKDLQEDENFRDTHFPRTITSQILSDYVFSQKPKKLITAVKILVDGINIGNIINQTDGARGSEKLLLPNECGRREVTTECFRRLSEFPKNDYAAELIGIANNNYHNNLEEWVSIARTLSDPIEITRWLEYAYRLQLIHRIDADTLIRIISEAEGANIAKRIQLIIRGNRAELLDGDASLKDTSLKLVLRQDVQVLEHNRSETALGFLSVLFHPQVIKTIPNLGRRISSISGYFHLVSGQSTAELMEFECVDKIDRLVRDFAAGIKDVIECEEYDLATALEPWDFIIESARQSFGESWNFNVLATLSAKIKTVEDPDSIYGDLGNDDISLCKRARFARLKSGNIKYWSEQIGRCPKLALLLFFTWATPRAIAQMLPDIIPIFVNLSVNDRMDLCNALNTTGEISPWNDTQKLLIESEAKPLVDLPEIQYILSCRFKLEDGRKFVYDHITSKDSAPEQINDIKFQYIVRAFLRAPNRTSLLREIKAMYAMSNQFEARFYYSNHFHQQVNIPTAVAKEIMRDCRQFPRIIASCAEAACRTLANSRVQPVGKIADDERWFEES